MGSWDAKSFHFSLQNLYWQPDRLECFEKLYKCCKILKLRIEMGILLPRINRGSHAKMLWYSKLLEKTKGRLCRELTFWRLIGVKICWKINMSWATSIFHIQEEGFWAFEYSPVCVCSKNWRFVSRTNELGFVHFLLEWSTV